MNNEVNQQRQQEQAINLQEQARLRDRIGYFNKNVDNILVNAPDPKSSHFQDGGDRFNRDFAAIEKANRERENKRKQDIIDSKR